MDHKFLCVVVCLIGICNAYLECPPEDFVSPCVCYFSKFVLQLGCEEIQDVEELEKVVDNMEGVAHEFKMLWIANSSLQYLPKELLESIWSKEFYMEDVTLQSIFLEPPTSLPIMESIRLVNVRLVRGVLWTMFSCMKNLKKISIQIIPVHVLKKDFGNNVPHTLQELEFIQTKTRKFEKGALEGFKDLRILKIVDNKIEEVHRDYFPVPFNIEEFNFKSNKLRTIPDDLFTNMPNLKYVLLSDNQIATVPESAFGGNYKQLQSFDLEDNPLKCDCSMRWIVVSKPFFLYGTCTSPKIMNSRTLKDIQPKDFFCKKPQRSLGIA